MSVPKKHKTSSKRNKGRSHLALKKTNLVKCPKCKTVIKPHRACPKCGYYKGEEVIKIKTSLDKKKSSSVKTTDDKKKSKKEAKR
ncbi:50S ribosomal protein L32 [bacterium]|nr:50S ribosomal protein L32 [bacterium]